MDGIDTFEKTKNLIHNILKYKGLNNDITFLELYNIKKKRFIVNAFGTPTQKITNNVIYPIKDLDLSQYFDPASPYKSSCKYDLIGIEETKDMIFKKTKWFDWFFNSGNYVLNKDTYINALKKSYEDKSTPLLDADTAAAFYFLLDYGVKFKIVKNFSHHHRLRTDSTWNTCGENSQLSVNYYKNLSIEL